MKSRCFLVLSLVFWMAGCVSYRNSPVAPLPTVDWKSRSGQVRYTDAQRTFVADVALSQGKDAREYSVEITKAGAVLLTLSRAENLGWAEGPLARGKFYGQIEAAPAHLQSWYLETTAVLENKPANPNSGIQYRLQR